MSQSVDDAVWNLYNKSIEEQKKKVSRISDNKREDNGRWTDKIVSAINISDLASEFGVDCCPECSKKGKDYDVYFDNSNGFFCCVKRKFGGNCDFCGNIVDFQVRCGR